MQLLPITSLPPDMNAIYVLRLYNNMYYVESNVEHKNTSLSIHKRYAGTIR